MKLIKLVNPKNVSDEEADKYDIRNAVRAIVFGKDNLVALLHATNNHYYKLPGGGIEENEDDEVALKRECKEEIGCAIEIIKELGQVIEYRENWKLKQISFCYIAKLAGEKGTPELTESETEEGFETVWLSIDDALKKVSESEATVSDGRHIRDRDTAILEEAKKFS